jgi:hypothetical protein
MTVFIGRKCTDTDGAMESHDKRLHRFQSNGPVESIDTLLNSLDNYFVRAEINRAAESNLWSLVVLGVHSVALTISEGIYGRRGLDGFKWFLESFVDADDDGFKFSDIAKEIHTYRNVVAHQWISTSGHYFGISLDLEKGWEHRPEATYFNPRLYYQAFERAFAAGGKIWRWEELLSETAREEAKSRLIKRYTDR